MTKPLTYRTRTSGKNEGQVFPIFPDKSTLPHALEFPKDFEPRVNFPGGIEKYKTMIIYEDDTAEMVFVDANDPEEAMSKALASRGGDRSLKVKTVVIHDGLGEVIGKLATGATKVGSAVVGGGRAVAPYVAKAGTLAARAAVKGGEVAAQLIAKAPGVTARGLGRALAEYESVKSEYQVGRLTPLMRDASSSDPVRRGIAKIKLREQYPEIYKAIGWERMQ